MQLIMKFLPTLLLSIAAATSLLAEKPSRPNIVYIMADDLGWADVGYNGAKFYETPNIDALCNPLSPPCIPPNPGFRDLSSKSKFLAAKQK